MTDPRDQYIHRVASGRTFAEVGGLWGTLNERVSVAHAAGARQLTMIDLSPAGSHWWMKFRERCRDLSVPAAAEVSGEILQLAAQPNPPRFDVVHCSGVLYHMPDPIRFLCALRRLTGEHLILTSSITADLIANEAGILRVPSGSALFIPALTPPELAVVRADWLPLVGENAGGITCPATWRADDFGPWWWLPTIGALKAMCEAAGFRVLDGQTVWDDHAYTVLLGV
jgi:Methyltransferase domain